MSGSGLAHKIPLQFLCERSKRSLNGNIKKNLHVNMFRHECLSLQWFLNIWNSFISHFCLQMVDFTVSAKPFLNSSSHLLIISVLYHSLAHNILGGGGMTLEIFWFIPCLDWGRREQWRKRHFYLFFLPIPFSLLSSVSPLAKALT